MDTQVSQQIQEGKEAFDRGDFRTSLKLFRQVLLRHPDFADIRNYAGLCLSFLGEPQEAIAQFNEALARNPGYVEAHINRALTLNNVGRVEEGREAFERAAGYEQAGTGEFSSAAAARLANAHAATGDLYAAARAFGRAAEEYRQALLLRPRFHDIRNKLGHCLLQQGELEAAEAEFRSALAGNDRFVLARINLGLVLSRTGRREQALAEWRRCEREAPDHPQVRAYLATLTNPGTATECVLRPGWRRSSPPAWWRGMGGLACSWPGPHSRCSRSPAVPTARRRWRGATGYGRIPPIRRHLPSIA